MKQFYRINIYETQAILYFILGFLIIHFGDWKWLGWLAIGWGWITFFSIFVIALRHHKELKEYFSS